VTESEDAEIQDSGEMKTESKPEIDIDKKIAYALSKVQKNFEETLKKRDAAAKK